MDLRDAIMLLVTGKQRVGKSFETLRMLTEECVRPDVATGKKAKKGLIFDTNFEYTQFKELDVKDIKRFTKQKPIEIRRVVPRNKDGSMITDIKEKIKILKVILADYAKGVILLEDINTYLVGAREEEIIGALTSLRHRETDVIIHYQTLAKVPTLMFENASAIRLHKQQDSIDRYKDRIPYYEILKIGEYLTNAQYFNGNIYFHCYVSSGDGHIRGNFTKIELREACKKYAERNEPTLNSLIKSYKYKNTGKNPREEAINEITNDLIKSYYR